MSMVHFKLPYATIPCFYSAGKSTYSKLLLGSLRTQLCKINDCGEVPVEVFPALVVSPSLVVPTQTPPLTPAGETIWVHSGKNPKVDAVNQLGGTQEETVPVISDQALVNGYNLLLKSGH